MASASRGSCKEKGNELTATFGGVLENALIYRTFTEKIAIDNCHMTVGLEKRLPNYQY